MKRAVGRTGACVRFSPVARLGSDTGMCRRDEACRIPAIVTRPPAQVLHTNRYWSSSTQTPHSGEPGRANEELTGRAVPGRRAPVSVVCPGDQHPGEADPGDRRLVALFSRECPGPIVSKSTSTLTTPDRASSAPAAGAPSADGQPSSANRQPPRGQDDAYWTPFAIHRKGGSTKIVHS